MADGGTDKRSGTTRALTLWLAGLGILVLAAAALLRVFVFQPFSAPSTSMHPNLVEGDVFLAAARVYANEDPRRGDIAVFSRPDQPALLYVKRIIGLPGDRIQMIEGVLHINGEAVKLSPEELPPSFSLDPGMTFQRETLPGGQSYVIADHGMSSADNTDVFTVPDGSYFMMGDNRDNSSDSRFTGSVPRQNLAGRMALRLFNTRTPFLPGRPRETQPE